MLNLIASNYQKWVIERPLASMLMVLLVVGYFSSHIPSFKLDASAESLVLENDDSLQYYRTISKSYGSDDFLIITYAPFKDLMSDTVIADLKSLSDELAGLPRVHSIDSILNVPLLNSPRVEISKLDTDIRTLETAGVDREMARKEFLESPIYKSLLMSPDGKITIIRINFKRDEKYFSLMYRRNDLRDKKKQSGLDKEGELLFVKARQEFRDYHAQVLDEEDKLIRTVRDIMDRHRDHAEMFLGGVPMITSDMIGFIKHDLETFGLGVLAFLVLMLSLFFKKFRWVALPMGCCIITVLMMVGFLGLMDWRVTVISSNFVSILLIITMSLTIHLIVRYRDINDSNPGLTQKELVWETVRLMAQPCFYTAITTIVAFISLIISGIRPVIDFGWIMTIGIALAFGLNFIFFPAALVLLQPEPPGFSKDGTRNFTIAIAAFTNRNRKSILYGSLLLALVSVVGIAKLEVENRFIDHFKSDTEIYQGMEVIDQQLGGTTPLDIIINPDQKYFDYLKEATQEAFDDPFADASEKVENNYWFNSNMLDRVEKIHDYLESLPEVGKVQSISTLIKVFTQLDKGRKPDDYDLALIRKLMPNNVKDSLVNPYLSKDANQIHINMRLIESDPTLRRSQLIEKIRTHLVEELKFAPETIHFTGMVVLYNNMLQSLYRSQILTIGVVFVSIMFMFMILFKSVSMALIGIVPNLLAAGTVLSLMGWIGIPLDMMTITIAAITVGIAVDDTIHYIHRFQTEFKVEQNYLASMDRCHGSIGKAMYYTSVTITLGFSILALSEFMPTIYFGLLTGAAMVVALIGALTLLPLLIVVFRPLGQPAAGTN
ncbi:MAG: MMPL family transporter [Nitrospinae bacterium]|nr:MMPL family transporter [Nitrospinota bacterium]MBL7020382.1 MMPL family transporter [Nitrospinaceae bacterium]